MKKTLCLAVLGLLFAAGPARSQNGPVGIAAVVNDDVVSHYDLQTRTLLTIHMTGLPDTPKTRKRFLPQVLRTLIDEKLKQQKAREETLTISEDEVREALRQMEKQNGLKPGTLKEKISGLDVPFSALKNQIRAEVAWMKVIRHNVARDVSVTKEEVDAARKRLEKTADQPRFHLYEISLPLLEDGSAEEVKETARRIATQTKKGASFSMLAREFSQSATAARGGNLGWVTPEQLSPPLKRAALALSPGEVSEPLRTPGGYTLLKLEGKRPPANRVSEDTRLDLARIFFPEAPSKEEIQKLRKTRSCPAFLETGRQMETADAAKSPDLKLSDMPPKLQETLADLDQNTPAGPVKLDEDSRAFLMICDRQKGSAVPAPETIRKRLRRQRVEQRARQLLRTLRRNAVIDIRI